tara:strand:- start:628 stop:846 length:219 start_codon:yes stop_codon:yes gene_type:complete
MSNEIKLEIQRRLDGINKIYNEMLQHSSTSGVVTDCGVCNNSGCIVCDEIDYDILAEEQAQQDAYENGRVFF